MLFVFAFDLIAIFKALLYTAVTVKNELEAVNIQNAYQVSGPRINDIEVFRPLDDLDFQAAFRACSGTNVAVYMVQPEHNLEEILKHFRCK